MSTIASDPNSEFSTQLSAAIVQQAGVVSVKSFGATGNGVTNDTAAIQAALNAVSPALGITTVTIPDGVYMIEAVNRSGNMTPWGQAGDSSRNRWIGGGLLPKTGTHLKMSSGAILKVIPNGNPAYSAIFLGLGQDNVTISGGQIRGDRAAHDYATEPTFTTHEWGYGIGLRGAKDVTIERVAISATTGDGVYVGAQGFMNFPGSTYYPSTRVRIIGNSIDGCRRNNISITGCDQALVEGSLITRAGYNDGIKDGALPKFGIDIENYGEGSVDFQSADSVTIHGNEFKDNALGAVINFNGYGVVIEGNHSDGLISFGFGTETIVSKNVVKNTANTTGTGISSNDFIVGEYDGNSIVAGNVVVGFGTGITVSRADVLVEGNFVSRFQNYGINVFSCDGVTVAANRVTDGLGPTATAYRIGSSTRVHLHSNDSHNTNTGVAVNNASTLVVVEGNSVTKGVQGVTVGASCQAALKGNTIDLPGHAGGQSYDITWAASSVVLCEGNLIRNSSSYSISAANDASGRSRIIGNRVIDSTNASQMSLSGGKHEVIGNTLVVNRSGAPVAILLSGSSDKSLIMGNTAYHSGIAAYSALVDLGAGTASNTRVVGNTIVTASASPVTGTDGGVSVVTGNNLVAA